MAGLTGSPLDRRNLAQCLYELSVANAAGIPIATALGDLVRRHTAAPSRVFAGVLRELDRGRGLSQAFEARPDVFDPLTVALVGAGEARGRYDLGLRQASELIQRSEAARATLLSRLFYPIVLLHLGIIIPNVIRLVTDGTAAFVASTLAALLPLYAVFAAGSLLHRQARRSAAYGRFILALPVVGQLARSADLARYTGALGALWEAGIPAQSALETAAAVATNGALRAELDAAARLHRAGSSVAAALGASSDLPALLKSLVATGERSGRLGETLAKCAEHYEHERRTATERGLTLVPIAIYLGAAGYVAFRVVSFYASYFGASGD